MGGIKETVAFEHGNKDPQKSIGDTAQCARVRMTTPTQSSVIGLAGGIPGCRNSRPVVERVTQSGITGVAHDDRPAFATLLGHRCYPSMSAQSVVISFGKRPRGLGEHRGGNDSSHSWQGPEDLDVAVLALLAFIALDGCELIQQGVQACTAALALSVD